MDPETFPALLTDDGQHLLAELRDSDPADELTAATRLRRTYDAPLVSAALGQARLRQRAAAKFGAADAARMYFTPHGVEQATRASVATHRAARFTELGVRRLADLCGGIGGDAIALARAGIEVLAVDRDPLTCAVARANAAALGLAELIEVRCADVTEVDTRPYDAVFIDPARRPGGPGGAAHAASTGGGGPAASGRGVSGRGVSGRGVSGRGVSGRGVSGRSASGRTFDPEAYSPPLSWALAAARTVPHAALKVAPGVPHEVVPVDAQAEWVSDRGDVKEAALWFGTGHRGVRATLLPSGAALLGATELPDPSVRPVGRYLYEPDGAVIRAHLVAAVARELNGGLIDPTIAYVTADEPRPTAFASAYQITDVLPFNLKRLKALLREREVGTLTVKKRGSAVEPEEVRRRVKPRGPHRATVFLTRVAGAPSMLIGQPAG